MSAFFPHAGRYRHVAGALALEVDPADGGRIVEFSLDGHNVLATREASPLAYGSSLWPSPQRDWDWPPPPAFDRLPYRASLDTDSLTLESEAHAPLGLAISQRLSPLPGGIQLEVVLHNRGSLPRAVAPWQNSRVRPGGLTFYPTAGPTYDGSTLVILPESGVAWLKHDPTTMTENAKSFGDGAEGWLAHLDGELLFKKSFPKIPRAAQAPTEAEVELYVDKTGLFVEVEQQGAYAPILPGKSCQPWVVRWQLARVPAGVARERGSAALLAWVRAI